MMRHVNRRLVLGWTSAMLAGTALAQPMGMQRGPGGGPGFGRGMNDSASYLAALKTQLHITPAQEPAWKEYADVVENVGNQMRAMHANVFESMQTATWQERQEMMNGMFQSRDEVHRMVQEAAETLKPHLTPEQQKLAATSLPGLMPFGPRGGMGHGQGMGMGRGPGMGQGMGPGMGQGPGAMPAQTQ